ncbi:MAG: RNA-binding protein [Chitinophagaceae bacterium]|nr:RNA-binding protein [Chitinophagaceae bacterium]
MNIYVSNLSFNVTDDDLRGFFEEYGNVSSAKVVMDKYTQRSRGFGFVEMDSKEEAEKAVAELNGANVEGRQISVAEARPREERSSKPAYSGNRW